MTRHNNDPLTDTNDLNDLNEDLYDTKYFSPEAFEKNVDFSNSFSILHLNIRSLNKNMENFKIFLSKFSHEFDVICLTETWCKENEISQFHLPNFKAIHQFRNSGKENGGGICILVNNRLTCFKNNEFSRNDVNCESLCIEIENKTSNNVIVNAIYRPPNGDKKDFHKFFKTLISKCNQKLFLIGDFNINILEYSTNTFVQKFFDSAFQKGIIPLINKPTRITRTTATAIDNILTKLLSN